MFDIYKLNETSDPASIKAKIFISNGLVKISTFNDVNKPEIVEEARNELEKAFKNKKFPRQIDLHNIKNKNIQNLILNIFSSLEVKNFFKELLSHIIFTN